MKANPPQLEVMPLFDVRTIDDIKKDFVKALYTQRLYESQIADFFPQSSAPPYLIKAYFNSKKKVQNIEGQIRYKMHGF